MIIGNRYSPHLMMVCDKCTSLPKKGISIQHPASKTALGDKALRAGWWMRPKNERMKNGEWTHCCPECVQRIINSGDAVELRAISSLKFAQYKLG